MSQVSHPTYNLFQRIGETTRQLNTGDVIANRHGKTFIFLGLTKRGMLDLLSTCDRRYFVTGNPADYNVTIEEQDHAE